MQNFVFNFLQNWKMCYSNHCCFKTVRGGIFMKRCVFYIATIICVLKVTALAGTNMTPVAVNGFSRDVVVQNTASHPPYTNFAMEFAQGDGVAYYEKGLKGYSNGLPVSR